MANTSNFILSTDEHKQVFEQSILNDSEIVKLKATSQEQPKAVILAGQPGAGKGTLAGLVSL
ncbi:MAG: zeta toxin family protein [Formosimonas sp.]